MKPSVIILMGIAGAGKTTVGQLLARHLKWTFCDGDSLHPQTNIDKIRQGLPLTDEDRRSWLELIRDSLLDWIAHGERVVLACSLLKQAYRATVLNGCRDRVQLIYLQANASLLRSRLMKRRGHFMREPLLTSQLEILEEPTDAIVVDASQSPDTIVRTIRKALE